MIEIRSGQLLLAAITTVVLGVGVVAVDAQTDGRRLVTVISDLHLGAGRDETGEWHPLEDFRWDDDLAGFLAALDVAGGGASDLVVNGDTFELWEPTTDACRYDDPSLGCTEVEARERLGRILAAHPVALDALAAFARSGSNRIFFVPGDHDAALLFPSVGTHLLDTLGAAEGRVEIRTDGYWASADGRLYAEHGHQLDGRANHLRDWPRPFHTRDGRQHLDRPWGDQTAGARLVELEAQYPIIDNMADRGAGLSYGLAASGISVIPDGADALLRYVLFRMPWSQFRVDLDAGDVQSPRWDLPAVRNEGPAFLLDSLPDDDRFKPVAAAAAAGEQLGALMESLTDAELTALCDYRAAVRRSRRRFERILTQIDPQGPVVRECPRDPETRGGAFDYFWRSRDAVFLRALESAQARLPAGASPIAVFVHGHTHLMDWRQRVLEMTRQGRTVIVDGFSPVRGALSPIVVNGGAWQRTITPVRVHRLRDELEVTEDELLRQLDPDDLAPCYSFVQIEPYDETPGMPVIRYWREGDDGWSFAPSCRG